MANRYCPRCLHSFSGTPDKCPNLACNSVAPDGGWGRLHAAGDLLDRTYRVRERVAVGGAGITYRARELDDDDQEVGPELAIKVMFQNAEGTVLRRLSTEARVLQELQHPHIVACRGFVHRTGKPAYLVMEYEAGGNLYDHVRHVGALPVSVATAIASQMLEALCVAHKRSVIHRDLKPQNILLRESKGREETPHVLLADFGIAKVSGFVGDNLTVAGTFLGTPEFAAPEQFKGLPPASHTDVYAAAAVFWYCLTGGPPLTFRNRTDAVECLRTLREELPPKLPASLGTALQRSRLEQVFANTLVFDTAARWSIPTFLESLAELDAPERAASQPLFSEPMGTMTPAALMEEPTPSVEEPATLFEEPPPPPERAPTPLPAPPRSTMDSFFELEEAPDLVEENLSLDDLFGGSTDAPKKPIREAQWETLATPPPAKKAPAVDWEPSTPEAPGTLSTDADRVRALGKCGVADRAALLMAIEDPARAISTAGTDTASRCGANLVAREHQVQTHAPRAMSQLQHADPDVRATAALALGGVGRPAQLTQINRLLSDKDARVRRAAVHGLGALGERTGRSDLVQNWLSRHHDPDPSVMEAVADYTNKR